MSARLLTRAAAIEVSRTCRPTPGTARVTFTGPAIASLPRRGYDHWFRFFLPRQDQHEPLLPSTEDWWAEVRAMPEEVRPVVRNYTVRRHRAEANEIDVDFVLHGATGLASAWAAQARPGDRAGLLDQGVMFDPAASGGRPPLIAGDEAALPAIAGIVSSLDARSRALVYIEVPDSAWEQPLEAPPGVQVHWLHRDAAPPGSLLAAVRAAALPRDLGHTWLFGESSMVTGVRRHLVRDRGVAKKDITFCGYWRRGRSVDES